MENKPKISVIVPVYNVEKYLSASLDSILAQDYENFEIVIVDDGATDGSPSICDDYAEKYPEKIKVVHQQNKGLGGARNTGIEHAEGEYLSFIDSDDTITTDMLSDMMQEILNTGADIAVCGVKYVYASGVEQPQSETRFPLHELVKFEENELIASIMPSACNKLFKKTLFTETGIRFPNKVWFEDLRTTTKLLPYSAGMVFTDKLHYLYLQRAESIIHHPNLDRNVEIIDAMNDVLDFYRENGWFDKYVSVLEYMTAQHVFWDSSARMLHSTRKHKLLPEFKRYTLELFPTAFENLYFKDFVAEKGKRGKIIFFCLNKGHYGLMHLILKINRLLFKKV